MSRFFSGNEGIAKSEETTLCITQWQFTDGGQSIDTTNACQSGFTSVIAGSRKGTGSMTFHYDAEQSPWADPPNLGFGSKVHLELFLENSSGPSIDLPVAMITSLQVTSAVNGVVTCVANFENDGEYTLPTTPF